MPAVAAQNTAPSTLAGVLRQIADVFGEAADATPILIGKEYLHDFGAGSPPRVLFVPEPRGRAGPPIEMGSAGSFTHSCNVLVRGCEDGSDLGRFDNAYALGDRVMCEIRRAAAGRLEFGDFSDDSPAGVDAYGADLAFSFTYQRDVWWDQVIAAVAAAPADTAALTPTGPVAAAISASGSLDLTTTPTG